MDNADVIDFDAALAEFEAPAIHVSEIDFDPTNDALDCGFRDIKKHKYLRADQSDLVIVAARPGVGKTSLALQICLEVAKWGNAMFFSLEMDKKQLKQRLYSYESETPLDKLKMLTPAKKEALDIRFKSSGLYIDDTNGIDLNTLMSRAIDFNRRKKLNLVCVDYLQIVPVEGGRSKAEEVGKVAGQLKNLAKELKCPVLALAQMNRGHDSRLVYNKKDSRPSLSDLADSSSIEKFADQVLFLHRQFIVNRERPGEADVYVAKNRHGPNIDFRLSFSQELAKFYDYNEEISL